MQENRPADDAKHTCWKPRRGSCTRNGARAQEIVIYTLYHPGRKISILLGCSSSAVARALNFQPRHRIDGPLFEAKIPVPLR